MGTRAIPALVAAVVCATSAIWAADRAERGAAVAPAVSAVAAAGSLGFDEAVEPWIHHKMAPELRAKLEAGFEKPDGLLDAILIHLPIREPDARIPEPWLAFESKHQESARLLVGQVTGQSWIHGPSLGQKLCQYGRELALILIECPYELYRPVDIIPQKGCLQPGVGIHIGPRFS